MNIRLIFFIQVFFSLQGIVHRYTPLLTRKHYVVSAGEGRMELCQQKVVSKQRSKLCFKKTGCESLIGFFSFVVHEVIVGKLNSARHVCNVTLHSCVKSIISVS